MTPTEPSELEELAVVKYGAAWCRPCVACSAPFALLAREHEGRPVRFETRDVDDHPAEANALEIAVLPTFVLRRGAAEVARVRGADVAAVRRAVEAALAA